MNETCQPLQTTKYHDNVRYTNNSLFGLMPHDMQNEYRMSDPQIWKTKKSESDSGTRRECNSAQFPDSVGNLKPEYP
jgi:hypothetical protein